MHLHSVLRFIHKKWIIPIRRYGLLFFLPWEGDASKFPFCNCFPNYVYESFAANKKEVQCKRLALSNSSFNFEIVVLTAIMVNS